MNERRRERLASFLEEELPHFFREEIKTEGAYLSIQYVEVIESGSRANIFVSVFPDNLRDEVAKELKKSENKASHFIRRRLGSKYSPQIRFQIK
jgi:ribosome-binding factor A